MTPTHAFVLADRALNTVVKQIRDDQWGMTMPPEFATMGGRSDSLTLRQVIQYHAYDEAWIPDMLAGRTMAQVGPTAYDGDLLGEDPAAAFEAIVDSGVAAAQALDDLSRTVHYSYGDFPAEEALWHAVSFRGLRSVDLARVIGVDDALDEDLAQAMYDAFLPQVELWRSMGVFGPEVPVPADAPVQERLLGLTGRQPRR